MSDNLNQTLGAEAAPKEASMNLRPTLFIGVGGTGLEVLMRVRRRILNTLWGSGARTRVESLADFPVAQFIQFDLDHGAVIESGRAQADDLQFDLLKFSDEDKIVESFDIGEYIRNDDALERYPHIKDWLPLTPKKIRDLGIENKFLQIRAIARLYFFDKYPKVRDKIQLKLKNLKSGLSHEAALKKLGLSMESSKFRIVVVGSMAGGTGSGSFLDFGLLARWLAKTEVGNADVELMLFLPTGFAGANQERTGAIAYAALMELESAMRGNQGYVGRWDAYDQPELPREPYNEVYLIDTGNLAQQHTKDVKDVYHMVADVLFEDFASGDFANRKRSVAVNQAQHKNFLHDALVPKNRFPDMQLSYSKRFSAMGQAVLDTLQEARRDELAHRWAGEMLEAFFGVQALGDTEAHRAHRANRATDKQRDEFMASHMALLDAPFNEFPEFSDKTIKLTRSSGGFTDYKVVAELLQDRNGSLLAGVEQRVNLSFEKIRQGFAREEWPTQVRAAIQQMERDAVRDQDSTADTTEDRVAKRGSELLGQIKESVQKQLYAYLDNKEFGGLQYVLSLVEQTKDRLEAAEFGVNATLKRNAERYREIKEAVRTRETERLLTNLEQTKGGLFNSGDKQAVTIMDQLRTEIANGIKFHLRAKAADEAATLMAKVSAWLGQKTGVDAQGRAVWSGLVGEFQAGREAVLDMLQQLSRANTILQQDLQKEHATLMHVPTPMRDAPKPSVSDLRQWADEAFKDLGGSKVLFPMLAEAGGRSQILMKVKRMAERQLALTTSSEASTEAPDPLVDALNQMGPAQRQEVFSKLLKCAMPWIDANLSGDFIVKADQYKCFIGVSGSEKFEKQFGTELRTCVPTVAGITAAQLSIVETGVPGRAVCYTELSGVPLTVLRGLEGWRTSYRKEGPKCPVHIHIDSTQFSHPIAPASEEINRLAEDFKYFLLAVMTGVLTRFTERRVVPAGQYLFAVALGDVRRIGNERAFRQNGLPMEYRAQMVGRVQELVDNLGPLQLAALSALSGYYESAVYTPKLVSDATGAEQVRKGFASVIAAEAQQEFRDKAIRKGLTDEALERARGQLLGQLTAWAEPIQDSDADAYEWEVRERGDNGQPRVKYMVKPDMLKPGALESLLTPTASAQTIPTVVPGMAGAPPTTGLNSIPPLGVEHQYFLGINGAPSGPFAAQQLKQMLAAGLVSAQGTKVWRQGLPAWLELGQLSELGLSPQTVPQMPPLT